jgi:hypothetical protein
MGVAHCPCNHCAQNQSGPNLETVQFWCLLQEK